MSTPTARNASGMPRWVKLVLIGIGVWIVLMLIWLALNTLA